MLVRLLYASRASEAIDEALLRSVLQSPEVRNREHGITRVLCTYPDGGVFLRAGAGALALLEELVATAAITSRGLD
jgi:hypothetical protein